MRRVIWSAGAISGIVLMTVGMWAVMNPPAVAAHLPKEGAMLGGLLGLFVGLFVAALGATKVVRPSPRF